MKEQLYLIEGIFIVIAVGFHHQSMVGIQVEDMGLPYITFDRLVLEENCENVLTALSLFDDTISKRLFKKIVKNRCESNNDFSNLMSKGQYFEIPPFAGEKLTNEVFIDCGAYCGDILEQYISERKGNFKGIIAFEPDARNCDSMKHRIGRLIMEWGIDAEKIKVEQLAVGKKEGYASIINMDSNKSATTIREGFQDKNQKGDIHIVSLDDYIKDKIHFIKADIEGYEMDLLIGAKERIRQDKPKIAICLYHRPSDLYEIPLYLKSLNQNYRFILRHYSDSFNETVLYAFE